MFSLPRFIDHWSKIMAQPQASNSTVLVQYSTMVVHHSHVAPGSSDSGEPHGS